MLGAPVGTIKWRVSEAQSGDQAATGAPRIESVTRMQGNDVDRAIDEAAREMTAGEPGPAFTTRVLARMQHQPSSWNWRWVMAPVSVAAATAVIVVALRTRPADIRPAAADQNPSRSTALSPSGGAPSPSAGALSASGGALSPSGGAPSPQAEHHQRQVKHHRRQVEHYRRQAAHYQPSSRTLAPRTPSSVVATLAPPPLDLPSMTLQELGAGAPLDVPAIAPLAPMTVASLNQPEGDQP